MTWALAFIGWVVFWALVRHARMPETCRRILEQFRVDDLPRSYEAIHHGLIWSSRDGRTRAVFRTTVHLALKTMVQSGQLATWRRELSGQGERVYLPTKPVVWEPWRSGL